MAKNSRLGVYWGETGFSLLELTREMPGLSAFVPFSADAPATSGGKAFPGDIALLELLQRTIRNKGFSTTEVYLSLPSKDILIRWFMIPWMKPSEIQNVVAFEAKKYIPFEVDEMSYTYYPTTIVKDNAKQIGIIFVAIRKESLAKYTDVLVQSGLRVVYSEPAAMAMVRTLVFGRQIDPAHVTAVLQTSGDSGELVITSNGHVKFIRDFKVQASMGAQGSNANVSQVAADAQDILRARIFSEVRISFEFFSRQYGEEDVNRLIILSPGLKQSFWTGMEDEIGIPVEILDPLRLVNKFEFTDKSMVNAFGVALAGSVPTVIDFNLSEETSKPVSLKQEEIARKNRELIFPVLVGIACAAIIAGIFFLGGMFVNDLSSRVAAVTERIGGRSEMAQEEIEQNASDEQGKLEALTSLPLKSRMTPLMVRLVKILPQGIVLESTVVTFEDRPAAGKDRGEGRSDKIVYNKVFTSAKMVLVGYVYLNDNNAEFDLANKFVNALRDDPEIAVFFRNIKMSSLKTRPYGKKKVTGFSVTCEGK